MQDQASACARLGAPTGAVNARNHAAGRALGRAVHAGHEGLAEPLLTDLHYRKQVLWL